MKCRFCWNMWFAAVVSLTLAASVHAADPALPEAKPVPDMQVTPLPYDQAAFEHQGRELTRYHFGESLRRPFWYPMVGPGGRSLTRMAMPGDPARSVTQDSQPTDPNHPANPAGHSHQSSVWISHKDVGGIDFWRDAGPIAGQIVHQFVADGFHYIDGEKAVMMSVNAWNGPDGQALMFDRRRSTVAPGEGESWWLVIDLQLEAPKGGEVTLGKTPFGPIGVRMAKSVGVNDGGGRILNSEGQLNEKEAFRKPARWIDYSGPIIGEATGGVTLMDHPANPRHPAPFNVRDNGWMGPALTLDEPMTIKDGEPVRLRYGLWVHAGVPSLEELNRQWQTFAAEEPAPFGKPATVAPATKPENK